MAEDSKIVKVKVSRFDPAVDKEPHYDTFEVETGIGFSVYNALQYINKNLDPSLAFYASCRIGQCFGCLVKVNGKTVPACTTMLTDDVTLDPYDSKRVLRDLTVKAKEME